MTMLICVLSGADMYDTNKKVENSPALLLEISLKTHTRQKRVRWLLFSPSLIKAKHGLTNIIISTVTMSDVGRYLWYCFVEMYCINLQMWFDIFQKKILRKTLHDKMHPKVMVRP